MTAADRATLARIWLTSERAFRAALRDGDLVAAWMWGNAEREAWRNWRQWSPVENTPRTGG